MPRTRLSAAEVDEALAGLAGWETGSGRDGISREFAFRTYSEALGFVVRLAAAAEAADHHPGILWTYTRVRVSWTTFDAGGITRRDLEMAAATDRLGGVSTGG